MALSLRANGAILPKASVSIPDSFGSQRLDVLSFPSGLNLHLCELSLRQSMTAPFAVYGSQNIFAIGFFISGSATFEYHGGRSKKKSRYDTARSMFYNLQGTGRGTYAAGEPLRLLSITFTSQVMHQLLGDEVGLLPKIFHDAEAPQINGRIETFSALTPSMRLAVHQAMHCPQDLPHDQLFLESKALELVSLYMQELAPKGSFQDPNRASPDERDRLHEARDILRAELAEPPTIATLSRRVGLNECKLKRLFKSRFGTTIYGFVQTERMRIAKTLLEEGMSVSRTASEMGYVNNSHFAAAFRKYHGSLPSNFLRD